MIEPCLNSGQALQYMIGDRTVIDTRNHSKCNIYVDASGDDGFHERSSETFTVALAIEPEEAAGNNQKAFIDIKRLLGCRPGDEIKYGSLKKPPKAPEAWRALHQLNCAIQAFPMIKSEMEEQERESIILNAATHALGIQCAMGYAWNIMGVSTIELHIDKSLKSIESAISDAILIAQQSVPQIENIEGVHFVDSKRVQMVQVADIFAGAIAEFLEGNLDSPLTQCRACPSVIRVARQQRICRPHQLQRKIRKYDIFQRVEPLLAYDGSHSLTLGPLGFLSVRWDFLNCMMNR